MLAHARALGADGPSPQPSTMRDVTHYEVLGVSRSASSSEVRRAYLQLARRHHPDVNAGSASSRQSSEREMQRVNEAWAVLGDEQRRRRYDDELRRSMARPTPKPRRADGMPSPDFVPFDPSDDDDDLDLLDDTPIPGTEVPRWLQLLGPCLLLSAIASFCIGLVTSFPPFFTVAVLTFVGALVSFLALPLVAISQSARSERQ